MALADLTESGAVLSAIEEADALGRQRFLDKYGFGPSRDYFLQHDGSLYDLFATPVCGQGCIDIPDAAGCGADPDRMLNSSQITGEES